MNNEQTDTDNIIKTKPHCINRLEKYLLFHALIVYTPTFDLQETRVND